AVKPSLSVRENLEFWAAFLGDTALKLQKALDAALDAVGLGPIGGLPAAYLSAGQRRRLSIARLIAVKRSIWLLDEPTSTLDAAARQRLAEFMRAHLAEGGLILVATHSALELDGAQSNVSHSIHELSLDQINPARLDVRQERQEQQT